MISILLPMLIAGAAADARPATAPPPPAGQTVSARPGIVRLRIDPAAEGQEAEIRALIAGQPFVRIAEPADYLITTAADFPLDISLVDLRQPPQRWKQFDEDFQPKTPEPRHYRIGNLRDTDTPARLSRLLAAASRLRALLDRSLQDMAGVEACLQMKGKGDSLDCRSLDGAGAPRLVDLGQFGALEVRNRSPGDRYVSLVAADGSLAAGWTGDAEGDHVRKLAPGSAIEYQPVAAAIDHDDDPRVMLLVSSRPFAVEAIEQPDPLGDGNGAPLPALALNDDLAVRSFQINSPEEPQPAMGNGSDVTARMAVWMAQFYSILPYTPEEIAADDRLPEEQTQFLALRSYEERQHRCGGTLIAPNLVLTAAHCVAKGKYEGAGLSTLFADRRVRLGTRKLGKEGHSYRIGGVAVHAGYQPGQTRHDLALLLLQPDRGTGNFRQQPLGIAQRPLPGGADALAFGWGFTGAVAPTGNIMMAINSRVQHNSEVLQYGGMRSVTLNECRRKLADRVLPGMVCMYSKEALAGRPGADGVFTCRGDSGGPLVRKVQGKDELVGVVSWSMGCGYKQFPSVFVDVGDYARWIAAAKAALKPGVAVRLPDPARP